MDIKLLAAYMSKPEHFKFINDSPNDVEKKRRIEKLKADFMRLNFSSVNFSADIEDVGNEEFSFMNDAEFNFADYNKAAKEQAAFSQLKKLTLVHSVKDSIKQYLTSRNESIRAANKIANDKKAKKKSNVSKPFWY